MSAYSDGNSFKEIMERMLSHELLEKYDKREGSVAYNTTAPVSIEIANLFTALDIFSEQSYLMTATGSNLDRRAADFGLKRIAATYAERIGSFVNDYGDAVEVPVGTRFSTPADKGEQIYFTYIGIYDAHKILRCDTAGTVGNTYIGDLVAIDFVRGLAKASIVDTYVLANDTESDDDFRNRVKDSLTIKSFGGNISQYIETVREMSGIGNCKIFPAWEGIGEVLVSVVSGTYDPVPSTVIDRIKEDLDPTGSSGEGNGLVPIGHKVTVTTPQKYPCDIFARITLKGGYIISDIQQKLIGILEDYFFRLRKTFAQDVEISVFRSRISEALLTHPALMNVSKILINGFEEDVTLVDTATVDGQHLPYLGEVTFEQTA